MFTALGNIFLKQPRHAENADARFDIRRHDPDKDERGKKNNDGKDASGFDSDDNATVTIEALRLFLENFLQSLATTEKNVEKNLAAANNFTSDQQNMTPSHPIDGETAKAVGAYGRMAQRQEKPAAVPTDPNAISAQRLSANEIRTIHQLLADLPLLTDQGIEYLTIERSESFLSSLVNAVEKAKREK